VCSAFGVAGLVQGLGVASLGALGIMRQLQRNMSDKKSAVAREGALLALERLIVDVGRLFEPFIVLLVPRLLRCYNDSAAEVRAAAAATARAIMTHLSGFGVRLIVPAIANAMKEKIDWREKVGAVELLGAMAYVQPRQLSASLPKVVPRLVALLVDTHADVAHAASRSLAHVAAVIRNPELQTLTPTLLKALAAPDEYGSEALNALLHTRFVHRVDAASLSLVMPVVLRGLQERSTQTKRAAANIAGSIVSLADYRDLQPYVDALVPGVRTVLADPVPESRSRAAHALSLLVSAIYGSAAYRALVAELKAAMRAGDSSIDRAGAAQGLAHVVAGGACALRVCMYSV
jgi:hypothetical protein